MTLPAHTPQPASRTPAEIWQVARADYLAGDPAPMVAERYGLSLRSLRRRASIEGWRRADLDRSDVVDLPIWGSGLSKSELIELYPELGEGEAVRSEETFKLLFDPTPQEFRQFAFRRAAELAATDSPRRALDWMRLVQALEKAGDRIDRDATVFDPADQLRADCIRRLNEELAAAEGPERLAERG
jgi:hypothetical protein